jgi:hypothetical protein
MRPCGLVLVIVVLAACGHSRELSPIQLAPMATLGADSGDGAMATTPSVSARHPGGFRIVVAAFGIQSFPLVFDDGGRYLGQLRGDSTSMGTIYQPMFTRFGPDDSIWVFDNERRVHIFDPMRRYVRTISVSSVPGSVEPPLFDAVMLPDDRIAAITRAAAEIQLLSKTGVVERDFGAEGHDGLRATYMHRIAMAPDGTLWTTSLAGAWRLEHWDTAGTLLGRLQLDAPWFVDADSVERANQIRLRTSWRDLPPPPLIQEIWFDVAGRLWVLGSVADRHWRAGLGAADSAGRQSIDSDKYYDTIVEVRDPRTGAVIATARFDVSCRSVAGPGELVHEVVTKAGWVRAELLRVVFDENAIHKAR